MKHASDLRQAARSLGIEVDPGQAAALLRFESLLAGRAIPLGFVARSESPRLRQRHILDSLRAGAFVEPGELVCDLGSGAGLPGLPVAVVRPDVRVVLIEAHRRRAAFLELAVQELALGNAVVRHDRVEDVTDGADACLARAFAPIGRAWRLGAALLRPGGRLVYFAGASWRGSSGTQLDPPPAEVRTVPASGLLESAGPLVIMTLQ